MHLPLPTQARLRSSKRPGKAYCGLRRGNRRLEGSAPCSDRRTVHESISTQDVPAAAEREGLGPHQSPRQGERSFAHPFPLSGSVVRVLDGEHEVVVHAVHRGQAGVPGIRPTYWAL